MAARTPSPFDSPPVSPLSPRGGLAMRHEVLFESYLQKTPPLEKIFVSWRKRYFVLSRTDPMDSSTLELNYYIDSTKKEKRGSVNLQKFVGLCPNAKVGSKDHGFAIETEERKYILRAPDAVTKNIWIAKLCELCGQEQVYHVTLPQQPTAAQSEAILKLYPRDQVVVMSPCTGVRLMEIPFKRIRRLGNLDAYNTDIVWFETCNDQHKPGEFYFFVVRSGLQTTHLILRELKAATECSTGHLLITEETNGLELSFISRQHYGCPDFPPSTKNSVLHGSLRAFSRALMATSSAFTASERRASEPVKPLRSCESAMCLSLDKFAEQGRRRGMSSAVHPLVAARRPTNVTLDHFRSNGSYSSSSHLSGSGSGSGDLSDSGVLNDVFDGTSINSLILSHTSRHGSREHTPVHTPRLSHESSSSSIQAAPVVPPRSRISLQHQNIVS